MAFGGLFGGSGSSDSSSSSPSESSPLPPPPPFTPTSGSSSQSSAAIRSRLQTAISTQSNLINAKYLIQKINENCFEHCVPDPGSSLSSKEQTCLSTCMEKYIEAWNVTSKTYVARLQREGASMGALAGQGGKELF